MAELTAPTSLLIVVAGVLIALAGPLSAWHYLRALDTPRNRQHGRVSLLLALSGRAPGLETLFAALAPQSLQPRRLIVAVESEDDPAFQRVRACRTSLPFPVLVVVAGLAESSGQKSKNLLAALAEIDDADDAVAFLDADIRPSPDWLAHLASPILAGHCDVVSGYRWQWLPSWKPATLLVAAIDRSIALLPRLPGGFMPWGGSVALGRLALERLDRARWLGRSMSDDCALGLEARRLGLRTLVRRALLVRSPLDGSARSLWGFGRRQYQMIRFHLPAIWWLALSAVGLRTLAWLLLLAPAGVPHAGALLGAMYGATAIGAVLQRGVANRLGLQDASSPWLPTALAIALKPVIDLIHLTMIAGATSNEVTWGHVRYRLDGRSETTVVERKPWNTR